MVEDGQFTWPLPFWEQPMHRWTSMLDAGVRAAFVASSLAAKMMVARRQGLIVNISYWAARKHIGNVIYGVSKAATDKMTSDMARGTAPARGYGDFSLSWTGPDRSRPGCGCRRLVRFVEQRKPGVYRTRDGRALAGSQRC